MSLQRPLISIVTPMLDEEQNVERYYQRVTSVMDSLDRYDYEIVITDNHSADGTFESLRRLAEKDSRVRAYRFSRNFGYQRSIWTGYTLAEGAAAIQLDADLQDPPELIPQFIEAWEKGAMVVYGVRRSRKEGLAMNVARRLFYRTVAAMSEDDLPLDAGDFRLVDRQILNQLRAMPDTQPYLRGTIAALGFNQVGLAYDRDARTAGRTKFGLRDLLTFSIDAILSHSTVPLRIASYTGLVVTFLMMLLLITFVAGRLLFGQNWPAGFATTTVLILLSISLNALFLGVIGEYLGRIYKQIKPGPITVIEAATDERRR